MRIVIFLSVLLVSSNPAAAVEAVDVDVANTHACALYDDGAVYCWGDPTSEDPPPFTAQRVAGLPPATAISVGGFGAACAVAGYGDLWCWGVDVQRSLRARELVQKNLHSGSKAFRRSRPLIWASLICARFRRTAKSGVGVEIHAARSVAETRCPMRSQPEFPLFML